MNNINASKLLHDHESVYLVFNNEIISKLNQNSTLGDIAKLLFNRFKINRSKYSQITFSLNDQNYNDLDIKLYDIGIDTLVIINVEFKSFIIFPQQPGDPNKLSCTTWDRDHYIEEKKGANFKLSLIEKCKFLVEMYLVKTEEIGNAWVEILLYRLNRAENAFEIRALREMVDRIKKLAKSYLVCLRDDLEKI